MAITRASFPHQRQIPSPSTDFPTEHVLRARLPTNACLFMLKTQARPPNLTERNSVLPTCPLNPTTASRNFSNLFPRPPYNLRKHGTKYAPRQQPFPSQQKNTAFICVKMVQKWDHSHSIPNTPSTTVESIVQTLQKRKFRFSLTIFEISEIAFLVYLQTDTLFNTNFQHPSYKMPVATRTTGTQALDLSRFDYVYVTYQEHPNHSDLHNLWIGVYGFDFPFTDLIDNAKTPPDFKSNIKTLIMNRIVAHVEKEATHTDAANQANIQHIIELLTLTILHDNIYNKRKSFQSDDDFINACRKIQQKAAKNERLDLTVQLNIAKLYVNFDDFDFLDFANYSYATAFPVTAASTNAAAAATAAATTTKTGKTLATHGTLMNCMQAMGKNISNAVEGMKASHSNNKIEHKCVPTNFHADLQDRYQIRHKPYEHLRKQDVTPIKFAATGKEARHERDPSKPGSSFMALSGDYFILQDMGPSAEKNLRSTVTKYYGKTVYEFHKWYTVTGSHMRRYNKYLHPYELFTSDITDPKGFTVGDGETDVVPATHDTIIIKDDRLLWDVLTTVFEKDSTEYITVQVHNGSGYAALYSLIARSHPNLVPEPSKLILIRPVQGKLNLLEYMHQYEHWLMLRTFIEDSHCTLNNSVEKQHFISGCNHSAFIEDQIRRERDIAAYAHKFEPSALIVTINGYLDLPNSPTKRPLTRLRNPYLPRNALPSRQTTRVQNLDMHPTNSAAMQVHNVDMCPTDSALNEVDTYDISDDDDNLHFAYTAACNRIRNDPETIIKPCLVCTVLTGTPPVDGHRFEQCPLLLNHDLLKTQVKGFCSLIMRGRNMTKAAAIKHTNAVTFEEIESDTSIKTDRDTPPDTPNRDFH